MSTHLGSRTARIVPLLLAGAALALTAAKAKQCVPTPQELICEKDSECGGPAPAGVTCEGAWACVDAGCEWVCDPIGGDVCYSSSDCGSGQHCTVDDGSCDPLPDCGNGFSCPAVCTGQCVDDQTTACWSDWDCPNGMTCSFGAYGAAEVYCPPCDDPTLPCEPCGAPMDGVCVAAAPETCDGIDNDGDGYVDEDGVCGSDCWTDSDCPAGWTCSGGGGGMCPPCVDPNGGACAPCFVEGGTCEPPTQQCWDDWDCPSGTVCDYGASDYYCPACLPGDVCAPCMPPYGYCVGSSKEICDGVDNDGDGMVDEDGVCGGTMCSSDMDCPVGTSCEYGGTCPPCPPGEPCMPCLVAYGFCSAPATEICDGMDNDGDGVVDGPWCPPADECVSNADCGSGAACVSQGICWDFCDPNGACGGGCDTFMICSKAP